MPNRFFCAIFAREISIIFTNNKTLTREMNKISNHILKTAFAACVALSLGACTSQQFRISGNISEAKDSMLYLDHMSLNGPVAIDSTRLGEDGAFAFNGKAPEAPEFYRLRIGRQIVNIAIDSTEQVSVKASYPSMSAGYEVSGSDECAKIKELALLQMQLQAQINAIAQAPDLGVEGVEDSVNHIVDAYKEHIKEKYIYPEPMKASAYFALFQTVRLGYSNALVFNPRNTEQDVKVFAAVATSWDTYYPGTERVENLHNIAIEGMKNVRILKAREQSIDLSKITVSDVIDIALPDNKGIVQHLNKMGDKVVLLDFHVFATNESTARIMQLRDLYNKYHAQGFEIFQVSLDPDEHFWKTSTAALPWICVRDERGLDSPYLTSYNVQALPTFFLVNRNNALHKRDAQIKDLEAEIRSLL